MRRASADGTSLQGFIRASYAELLFVLGAPDDAGDGFKIDARWARRENGVTFTVYNYKDGPNYRGLAGVPVFDIRDWHIGGAGFAAVDVVRRLFPHHAVEVA